MRVISPRERQVFQRGRDNRARVPVQAQGMPAEERVEARLVRREGHAGENSPWVTLEEGPDGRRGELDTPAGGWYSLELRTSREDAFEIVERVGVGEVFLVAGQSNAANSGERPQRPEDDRVVSFDGESWWPGEDPQRGATGDGGTPWPQLGDLLTRGLDMPVAFASVAVGGTQTGQWLPEGGEFWPRLARLARSQGARGARAVLWHQGESDALAGISSGEYARRLRRMIGELEAEGGGLLPWVVAGAGYHPDAAPEAVAQVRAGQRELWEEGVARQGPLTDDLVGERYRYDGCHFTELGLRVHAERWFALLWPQFFAEPELSCRR